MNKFYEDADKLLTDAANTLSKMCSAEDGEDLGCYCPEALDKIIVEIIKARSMMAVGVSVGDTE